MCVPAIAAVPAAIGSVFSGLTAAAGSAFSALTVGGALALGGTALSTYGQLQQGKADAAAARLNAKYAQRQARTETMLAGVEDERLRERMRMALSQQRADLAGRGISLDSPTAVLLGQTAARELSFASQSARAGGAARAETLSAESRAYRASASSALLTGRLSAAAGILTRAPEIWPGLSERRVLS